MPVHLIIQYCNDPRPPRQAEYDECVRRNLDNPHVAAVHNLVEPHTLVPDAIRSHARYREHPLPRWMTYRDVFDFANAKLAGEIAAIANLDIFLDPTAAWNEVTAVVDANIVLCLSRIEFDPSGRAFKD